jgi:hypothetical protein
MSDTFEPGEIRHDLGASAPGSLATYNVLPCEPDPDPGVMPPVVLTARARDHITSAFVLQDYFTPQQAEDLADALRTAAARARTLAAEHAA